MKKIVRQQNYLKELINSQDNKIITKQFLKCMLRAVLGPLLDNPEEGVVLHRINNTTGLSGLMKRLEFAGELKSFDFTDDSENLKEKVWADTEFLCVLTHRFVVIIIWDNKTESKNYVRYYSVWNSKLQNEALDIISRNSKINVKEFQEHYKPDRRDNKLLNSSIRTLIENMDEAAKDAVLGFAEYQIKPSEYTADIREISHEIKNQLSICDLYSEVIKKYCEKNNIQDETVLNGAKNISKAIKMAANSLISLKSEQDNKLTLCELKNIINSAEDLTKIYFECKNIAYTVESKANLKIMANEESLIAALINLIKNASEAFTPCISPDSIADEIPQKEQEIKNGKYVKVKTEKRGDYAVIRVLNNAGKIENPEKLFEKGYTTKQSGSGLGLIICKKSIEKMNGELLLVHNDDNYTEFVIKIKIA